MGRTVGIINGKAVDTYGGAYKPVTGPTPLAETTVTGSAEGMTAAPSQFANVPITTGYMAPEGATTDGSE